MASRNRLSGLAYAGIALIYTVAPIYSTIAPAVGLPKARAAVAKALELDKSLAEAHAILAYIRLVYDRDDEAGEKEFRRAIELNPNDSTTLRFYGASLLHLGRFGEAEAAVRQALEIDPLSLVINTLLGLVLIYGRRYDAGLEQLHKTLEMDPNFPDAHYWLAWAQRLSGKYDEALRAAELYSRSPQWWYPASPTFAGERANHIL